MKHYKRIVIWGIAAAVSVIICYQLLPSSEAGRLAVERLATAHQFSLGPSGPRASISESEDAFFTILASRHSSRLFRDLYERGTPEAKCYVLCGLHLTYGGFNSYAARFTQETVKISTLGGCIVGEHTSPELVSAIRQGRAEQYLPFRQKMEESRKHQHAD
jgi:hypothetical protein